MALKDARYRWFKVWLTLGTFLAVLLLLNSMLDHIFVSRRIAVEQRRREMGKLMIALEQQARQGVALASLVSELQKDQKIAWVEVRGRDGQVLAHSGIQAGATFTEDQVRSRSRNREPVFAVRRTAAGEVVVEAFPLRLPPAPNQPHAASQPPQRGGGMIEMAMPLEGAGTVYWPLRVNLIINCSAALALIVSLLAIGLRFRSYLEGKHLEQQVEIARHVQQALLPPMDQVLPDVTVAAEFVPAWRVGGDFYDLFPVNGRGFGLVVGDVSGKGIPAALLTGVIHGAVRSSNFAESPRAHQEATGRLNRLLCERASGERFATMFWSYYDPESQLLRYVNAGHCPPLLVRKGGHRAEIARLEEGGPVLGLLPESRYSQAAVQLREGDLLILYSDGVAEAANAAGEEFGEERLLEVVEQCAASTPDEIRREILAAVQYYLGSARPEDDLTLVAVRFGDAAAVGQAATLERAVA